MKVAICSGGTGGHIFPACALFKAMQQKKYDVTVITDIRGSAFCNDISKKIIIKTVRFSHKNPIKTLYYLVSTLFKLFKLWFANRPDIVIGFGGIFTVIPMSIAKILGSKVVVYEQNSVIGRANKFLKKFANLKLSSFGIGEDWVEIQAPVRAEFMKNVPYRCDGKIKILIIGGSQGAASFSDIIPQALTILSPQERQNIEIVQQISCVDEKKMEQTYKNLGVKSNLQRFVHNIADIMIDSQLVICRSGASTLSELSATGRPAILIPYPHASDNHQFCNALYYKNKGAAWVLDEKDGVGEELGNIIHQILQNRELLKIASFHMMNSSVNRTIDDFLRLIELI